MKLNELLDSNKYLSYDIFYFSSFETFFKQFNNYFKHFRAVADLGFFCWSNVQMFKLIIIQNEYKKM